MKHILKFSLYITLFSSLGLAFTPAPLPSPNACTKDYNPVCGENITGEEATFSNLCKLELSHFDITYTVKHMGACKQTSTPTPNPLPVELTCDKRIVSTTAQDINLTIAHGGDIYIPSLLAHTNHPNVSVNPDSIRFVTTDGKYDTNKYIPNVGTWSIGLDGMVIFSPDIDINASERFTKLESNSTISIKYVINNNCDKEEGISNKATLTISMVDPSKNLHNPSEPWFGHAKHSCFSRNPIDAINDTVVLKKGEKIKTISVLENDTYLGYSQNISPHYVFASLRLIDEHNNFQRRINIRNKGTWLADTTSGKVLFVPEPNFVGESSIKYSIHSSCSSHNDEYTNYSKARITIIAPTPTPCPQTKKPVCGQENLCHVSPSGEKICLASIPHNTTYPNMCELFEAGDVFLYDGICHTPTPTPTPKIVYVYITPTPSITPTPTATPKPTVVTPSEEPQPTTTPTQTTETNTSKSTPKVKSSNGSALGSLDSLLMMLLTGMIGLWGTRREDI